MPGSASQPSKGPAGSLASMALIRPRRRSAAPVALDAGGRENMLEIEFA
jgi:hypothetical protein